MSDTNFTRSDNWAQRHKQLRLFISSTFVDMNTERDALTRIFPQIKEICNRRGVEFIPLDLRWGITESAAQEGRVVETCLREIDESRPFFIGIIGHRYGWVPTDRDLGPYNEELKKEYPWLDNAMKLKMSITEMEMQYAVLMGKVDDNMNASFYLRSDKMKIDKQHKETPGSEADKKLKQLRATIKSQTRFKKEEYDSEEALAEMVLKDISMFLDKAFPDKEISSYDANAERQEYAFTRKSKSLITMDRYSKQIDTWICGRTKKNILITGHRGRGKSYLQASIVKRLKQSSQKVIYVDLQEIESTPAITSAVEYLSEEILNVLNIKSRKKTERDNMLGCILSFFWNMIKITGSIFITNIRMAFGNQDKAIKDFQESYITAQENIFSHSLINNFKSLAKVLNKRSHTTVYIAIDNLDSLKDDELCMFNIFDQFPQIRLIYSASINTKAQQYLQSREDTELLTMSNLDYNQACEFINNYLARFGKELDTKKNQCNRLIKSGIAGNPQLLEYTLNLMVRFGSYEMLDNYITELSTVKDESSLYNIMISNIFKQFKDGEELVLVKKIMAAFAIVKDGLSEIEIQEIFSPKPLEWALLRPYLFSICKKQGKLWRYNSEACRKSILSMVTNDITKPLILTIANHFENTLVGSINHEDIIGQPDVYKIGEDRKLLERQVKVLPTLYYEWGDIKRLYNWVTYIRADYMLSQEQRVQFWRTLYKNGYAMHNCDNIDIPPYMKTFYHINPTVEKIIKGKAQWLKSLKHEQQDFYNRWNLIASFFSATKDMEWLANKLLVTTSSKEELQTMQKVTKYQTLMAQKKFDDIIEYSKVDHINDNEKVFIDLFIIMAYIEKGDKKSAFSISQKNINDIKRHKAEDIPELITNFTIFGKLSCQFGTLQDVDLAINLLMRHKDSILSTGLGNLNSCNLLHSLSLLLLRKGEYDQALSTAQMLHQSITNLGGDVSLANKLIEQAKQCNAEV